MALNNDQKNEIHKILMDERFGIKTYSLDNLLGDDLGLDSLDLIELVMAIEETFDIDLSSNIHGKIAEYSVGNLYDSIDTALKLER